MLNRATLFACIAVVCGAVALFLVRHSYSLYDDAYIYFRYVENLFGGCGLRFNCGEAPVEGFTSPLYFALLAAARPVHFDLETASQILGALSLAAALSLTIASALHPRLRSSSPLVAALSAVAVTIALAFDHRLLVNATTGLETALRSAVWPSRWCFDSRSRMKIARQSPRRCSPSWSSRSWRCWWRRCWCSAHRPAYATAGSRFAAALVAMTATRFLLFRDLLPNTFWAKTGGSAAHLRLGLAYSYEVVCDFPLIVLAPLGLLLPTRRAAAHLLLGAALAFAFSSIPAATRFRTADWRHSSPRSPCSGFWASGARSKNGAPLPSTLTVAAAAAAFAIVMHPLPSQHAFPTSSAGRPSASGPNDHHAGARD